MSGDGDEVLYAELAGDLRRRSHRAFERIFKENFLLIAASMIVAWLIVEVTNISISSMFGSQLMYTAFDGILSFSILLFLPLLVSIYAFVQCQRLMSVLPSDLLFRL